MKVRDLLELTRGLDDKGFLDRFPCPFLLEEGLLPHETKLKIGDATDTSKHSAEAITQQLATIAERQVFPLRRRDGKVGDVTVGRGELMDVRLDLQSVSTRHAVLKAPGDGRARWRVVDTVSTNGTFVDGVRIATGREVELSEATVVRFGPELRLAYYESQQLLTVL